MLHDKSYKVCKNIALYIVMSFEMYPVFAKFEYKDLCCKILGSLLITLMDDGCLHYNSSHMFFCCWTKKIKLTHWLFYFSLSLTGLCLRVCFVKKSHVFFFFTFNSDFYIVPYMFALVFHLAHKMSILVVFWEGDKLTIIWLNGGNIWKYYSRFHRM